MPGLAFHITARTQGHEEWFEERLRPTIERIITEGVTSSDSLLLAHSIMPNHFHIVLRQGQRPLGYVMHPVMRRIALLVQRAQGVSGHVFERRFRSYACENADYLRRAIVYTHLNAQRAGLCPNGAPYRWSSQARYELESLGEVAEIQLIFSLKLFANEGSESLVELRQNYRNYIEWRQEKDRHDAAGTLCGTVEPVAVAGDVHFANSFCALPPASSLPTRDLRDKAKEILLQIDPNCSIEQLRGSIIARHDIGKRKQLIAALLQAGYKGRQISDFLQISQSSVSKIATLQRYSSRGGA